MPQLYMIIPVNLGEGGGGAHPGHDLPLFPTHLPVVPPGGAWPGQPPAPGGGAPVYPSHPIWRPDLGIWGGPYFPPTPGHDLPLFPSNWPVVPPGGAYPPGGGAPGGGAPVDPGYGVDVGTGPVRPTHPIVIPPQQPVPQPDGKVHVVAYMPNPAMPGGYERITFSIEPPKNPVPPPTEGTPKPVDPTTAPPPV